jgi:hypothetical protein
MIDLTSSTRRWPGLFPGRQNKAAGALRPEYPYGVQVLGLRTGPQPKSGNNP